MHAITGGCVGQAFALAGSNDSGEKKSRIRRSKEERKMMVESFINKYQKSNDGNFPSLNLTHKEVGGSFYTVREIVREIIQENRVLAPRKVFLEEHNHCGFLEQRPLESVSVEPQDDLSLSDELHIAAGMPFLGPDLRELHDERVVNGLSTDETGKESDRASHPVPQPKCDEFENEKIVNGCEGLKEDIESGKPFITNSVSIDHQDSNDEIAFQSSQKNYIVGSWKSADEQYLSTNDQMVDKTKESGQQIYTEPVDMEMLDREKDGVEDLEVLQRATFHMSTNFVVETFPLRPVSRTILDLDGDSSPLHEAPGTLERDKKARLNLQELSFENSKFPTTLSTGFPDVGNVKDLASRLSEKQKAERLMSEDSCTKSDKHGLILDRVNLETSEGATKISAAPASNPLLAFVKAFVSAFVKLWTE
ncbi:hypothetical protein Salat_0751700 [Sesamum alatum]|uniref:AT3G52170-like helix-turn-helix domain-containing protein n=1 Tax=Sesamum alatum TaxID=300844 RepID=A0AAE1YTE6_9LAMI|nr:hypothetical protein Salat_0751700 [Sesamum alatum]